MDLQRTTSILNTDTLWEIPVLYVNRKAGRISLKIENNMYIILIMITCTYSS